MAEHVGDPDLTQWGDDGPSDQPIYQRDMARLDEASLILAEGVADSLEGAMFQSAQRLGTIATF